MPERVKAAVVSAAEVPPSVETVELHDLRDDEVLIRIAATGVCHTDIAAADGGLNQVFPVILGHESAGVIDRVGAGVERVKAGDHVVLSLAHHCGHCFHCEQGSPMLCDGRVARPPRVSWNGVEVDQGFGTAGFAEATVVKAVSAVPIPKSVPLEVAAVMGCALATGFGAAMNIAAIRPGSRVAILGCGGIGLSVLLGAVVCGAERIVVVDPDESRRAHALQLGATDTVADADGLVEQTGAGEGFDYVFEATGHVEVMRQAFDATRRGATTILMGVPRPDEVFSIPALDFVSSQRRILGCLTGDLKPNVDFDAYFRLYERGKLDLDSFISARLPLAQVAEAFERSRGNAGIRTLVTMG